jgi:hypothetical protein
VLEDPLEFNPSGQAYTARKACRFLLACIQGLMGSDGRGPWRGGRSGLYGHPQLPYVRGNRGYGHGVFCSVGRFFS